MPHTANLPYRRTETAMQNWVREFYAKQAEWSGAYWGDVRDWHRQKARWVRSVIGPPPRLVLELGAGGGQDAVALAEEGYTVVAVEQEPILAGHIRRLIKSHPKAQVQIVEADFYKVRLPEGKFGAVCYWDGFGLGSDNDQRALLRRIRRWLAPNGVALIDVFTPWHAAKSAGYGFKVGKATRRYSFDGEGCRWIDRWQSDESGEVVVQSLRCYSPADLKLLTEGTGLYLSGVKPGGMMDYESGKFYKNAPLEKAMWFVAILRPR